MQETPQQYQRRILSHSANRDPLKILRETPNKIKRLIQGLSIQQMHRRPAPRKWSIAEIIAHLADTELTIGFRYRQVLSQSGIALQAIDQDAWASNGKYNTIAPGDSFALFHTLRAANLRLLKKMPRSRWDFYGIHEERGKETMRTIALMEAGHDVNHLSQIKKIAGELRRGKKENRSARIARAGWPNRKRS